MKFHHTMLTPISWSLYFARLLFYSPYMNNVTYEPMKNGKAYGFNNETGGLIIKNVTFDDAALYYMGIEVPNTRGSFKSVEVKVEARPSILKDRSHIMRPFSHAKPYKVRCVAFGFPIPMISFYDEKDEFLTDYKYRTLKEKNERDSYVQTSGPRKYVRCVAKNKHGENSLNISIPPDAMFGNVSKFQRVVSGEDSVIRVEIIGDELPNLKWEIFDTTDASYRLLLTYDKNSKKVTNEDENNKRYSLDNAKGHLMIKEVTTEDITLYKVTIQDWLGWNSITIGIEVDVPASLVKEKSHIIKPVGHKAFQLQCAGTGGPTPDIIFQDDKGKNIEKEITNTKEDGIKTAVLKSNVLTSFVECIVKNKHGQDSMKIEIPNSVSFGDISTIQNLQSGTDGTIKVNIKTNEMPDTKWEKLDETSKQFVEILSYKSSEKSVTYGNDSYKVRYQFDKQHGHLIIKNINSDDAGSYKISVNGNFGWISKTIKVDISTIVVKEEESLAQGIPDLLSLPKSMLGGIIGGSLLLIVILTCCCVKRRRNAQDDDIEKLRQKRKKKKKLEDRMNASPGKRKRKQVEQRDLDQSDDQQNKKKKKNPKNNTPEPRVNDMRKDRKKQVVGNNTSKKREKSKERSRKL